jgi:hypothetical protein
MRILFGLKQQHLSVGSWGKLHTCLKRELAHRQSCWKSFQQQSTCFVMFHVCITEFAYKQAKMPGPSSHGKTWLNMLLQVPLVISVQSFAAIVQWGHQYWYTSPF